MAMKMQQKELNMPHGTLQYGNAGDTVQILGYRGKDTPVSAPYHRHYRIAACHEAYSVLFAASS